MLLPENSSPTFFCFQLENVSSFDYFKEEMGYRLADRVLDVTRDIETVVDISSGRGFVTRHLENIKKVVALEMSQTYLDQCQMPPEENVRKKNSDNP